MESGICVAYYNTRSRSLYSDTCAKLFLEIIPGAVLPTGAGSAASAGIDNALKSKGNFDGTRWL
jgi:hypothetical protein